MLFSASMARNMFRVSSVNRAAREAALSTVEAIPREGSDDDVERSDLVNDNGGKKTLLLPEML